MYDAVPDLLFPLVICLARIVDVSIGTLRTVAVVRGRVGLASVLGFFEVLIWITVVGGVMSRLDNPWNVLGYALGFALGNAVGIALERRLALGTIGMRIITRHKGTEIAGTLRERGVRVTEFEGRGRDGPVTMLYSMMDRVDAAAARRLAEEHDPDCFVVFDDPRAVNRALLPALVTGGGVRGMFQRK